MALNIVIILLNPSCSVQEEFYFRTLFISTILINLTIARHTRLRTAPLWMGQRSDKIWILMQKNLAEMSNWWRVFIYIFQWKYWAVLWRVGGGKKMNCSIMSREYWAVEFISYQQSHGAREMRVATNLPGMKRDGKVNIQPSTCFLLC